MLSINAFKKRVGNRYTTIIPSGWQNLDMTWGQTEILKLKNSQFVERDAPHPQSLASFIALPLKLIAKTG